MCADNTLTTLDVSNNVALEAIDCSNNKLTQLSFDKNVNLVNINCSSNSLTNIDLQNGQDIRYLDCSRNKNLQYVVLSKGKRVFEDKKDSKTYYK
jgi:Leucine-rich repeat (LRR) protein